MNFGWFCENYVRETERYKKVTSRSPKGTLPAAIFKGAKIITFFGDTKHLETRASKVILDLLENQKLTYVAIITFVELSSF